MRPLPLNEHFNLMWQLKKTYKPKKKKANSGTEKDLVYYKKKKKKSIVSIMVFDRPGDHFNK